MALKFWLNNIALASILFAIYFLLGAIFDGNHPKMLLFFLPAVFIVSFLVLQKLSEKRMILACILPFWLVFFVSSIFIGFLYSLAYVLFIPLFGWLAILFNRKKHFLYPVAVVFVAWGVSALLFPNTFEAMANTGARVDKAMPELNFLNENGKPVSLDSGLVVLDFWTTSCSVCFKKFPDYNEYSIKYANDPDIKLYAVNVPTVRDKPHSARDVFSKFDYHFPTLYAASQEEITDKLGFELYPHLLIIKDGRIKYSGRMITDKKILFNRLDQLIRKYK